MSDASRASGSPAPDVPSGVGQIAIPVTDLERATAFYRDVVGLDHLFSAPPGLSFFGCGGVRLMLAAPEDGAAGPPGSLVYFRVDDIHAAHARITGAGARVEHEPAVVHRTDASELWISAYRDSEGNVFAFMREVATG